MAAKKNLEEAIIGIEAEKAAVRDRAQAFIRAKATYDAAQGLDGNNTWAKSREGRRFIDDLNKNGSALYAGTQRNEFTRGERLSAFLLPRIFGGPDEKKTNAMRELQRAQSELEAAQTKLHQSMDSAFGTRTDRLASGDKSLLEAAKTIGGGFGLLKGLGRIAGGVGSILLGGADDRFGEVHIKNGGLVVTGPRADDRPSLFKGFMSEDSHVCGGGLRGIAATPFVFLGQLTGIGHPFHPIDAFLTLGKGVESALYLAADIALTVAKVPYTVLNIGFNVAKTVGLLGKKAFIAGAVAIGAMIGKTADFTLESHVVAGDLTAATDLATNTKKHEAIDNEIANNPEANAAKDAARDAKAKEIDAANSISGNNRSPQQKIEINAAGREAGRKVLKAEVNMQAIIDSDNPAAIGAYNKIITKPTGWRGQALYKNDAEHQSAAIKAGLAQLGSQAPRLTTDANLLKATDKNAARDRAVLANPIAAQAAKEEYDRVLQDKPGAFVKATLAARKAGEESLAVQDDMIKQNLAAKAAANAAYAEVINESSNSDEDQTIRARQAGREAGLAVIHNASTASKNVDESNDDDAQSEVSDLSTESAFEAYSESGEQPFYDNASKTESNLVELTENALIDQIFGNAEAASACIAASQESFRRGETGAQQYANGIIAGKASLDNQATATAAAPPPKPPKPAAANAALSNIPITPMDSSSSTPAAGLDAVDKHNQQQQSQQDLNADSRRDNDASTTSRPGKS